MAILCKKKKRFFVNFICKILGKIWEKFLKNIKRVITYGTFDMLQCFFRELTLKRTLEISTTQIKKDLKDKENK